MRSQTKLSKGLSLKFNKMIDILALLTTYGDTKALRDRAKGCINGLIVEVGCIQQKDTLAK